jgi:hypothetical protein
MHTPCLYHASAMPEKVSQDTFAEMRIEVMFWKAASPPKGGSGVKTRQAGGGLCAGRNDAVPLMGDVLVTINHLVGLDEQLGAGSGGAKLAGVEAGDVGFAVRGLRAFAEHAEVVTDFDTGAEGLRAADDGDNVGVVGDL